MTLIPGRVVLLFHDRFVEAILERRKCQTIRNHKRPPMHGTTLSLRSWLARPYRSDQRVLLTRTCSAVRPIQIEVQPDNNVILIALDGVRMDADDVPRFVRADGFNRVSDMVDYYVKKKTLSFEGQLIEWFPE